MSLEVFKRDDSFTLNVAVIKKEITEMLTWAKGLYITTQDHYLEATSKWRVAKDLKKSLEEQRKELIEPARKAIAQVNDQAKELTDPLTEVETLVKQKTAQYQELLEKKKQQEIADMKEAHALIGSTEPVYVQPVPETLRGDGALAYTKTVKKFRVVDATLVPRDFLKVDDEKVTAMIKLGLNEIPGLEIYEEKQTILRSR